MRRVTAIGLLFLIASACRPAVEAGPTTSPVLPPATVGVLVPTSTPRRLPTELPASSPTLTQTSSPQVSLTPTLGPLLTRTPAPPERCPERMSGATFESDYDIEHVELAILGYLNAGGDPAQLDSLLNLPPEPEPGSYPSLSAKVYADDLTGDGVEDYALQVDASTEGDATSTLLVLSCYGGLFEASFIDRYSGYGPVFVGLLGIIDLNGNGVPELIYYVEEYGAGADSTTTVIPVEWEGTAFKDLVSLKHPIGSYFDSGASMYDLSQIGEVHAQARGADLVRMFPDADGNGTREIMLTGGVSGRYWTIGGGPERLWTDTWMWNGEAFTLRSTEFEPPEFRFQAIRDGDAATLQGEYERALAFYQQAVFDEALFGWNPAQLYDESGFFLGTPTALPVPEERPRLNAYGRYRILLLHAAQGNDEAADIVYTTLLEKFPEGNPGHPYAALADVFWQGFLESGEITAGCERAKSYAAEHAAEILAPLGSSIYGFFYEDYAPVDICPFN